MFSLTQEVADRPIAGFLLNSEVTTTGGIGPLAVGERRLVPCGGQALMRDQARSTCA